MTVVRAVAVVGGVLALNACAPVARPVVGLPPPGKDVKTFQAEDADCHTQAARAAYGSVQAGGAQVGGSPAESDPAAPHGTDAQWQRYFATYTQCEASHGNTVTPVPWAVYLGYGYPGYGYGAYAYDYPYGYYYGYPYFYGYPYPFLYSGFFGFGYGHYGHGFYGHGGGGYGGGYGGGGHGGGGHH
jgi:hypothetical protein